MALEWRLRFLEPQAVLLWLLAMESQAPLTWAVT